MLFSLYFFRSDNPFHNSFFVNKESGAESTHISTSVQFLFSLYAEFFH